MKNVILAFTAAILLSFQVKAQTQTQDLNMSTYQLQFPSSSGGNNRVQTSGSGTWLFKSRFDNIVFQSGEDDSNPRDIIFGIGNTEKARFSTSGNLGIGTTIPDYKLTVIGAARVSNTNSSQTADAWFSSLNGSQAYGLFLNTTSQTGLSYSVVGFAETNTGTSAGIYGRGTSTGTGATSYAGYFNGNLAYTGTFGQASDEKFKEGITDIKGSLSKIIDLKPKEYSFKKIDGYDFPSGKRPGFLAQELNDVFPELVSSASHLIIDKSDSSKNRTDKYLSVDYISLIPHIVKAIQEQNNLLEEYKNSVTLLQDILLNQSDTISLEVLTDIPHIIQLFPNPTSALLSIKINNPSNGKATLSIKDKTGVTRLTVVAEKTTISTSISDLEDGLFFVELIIDGTTYDIKRFIITK